MWSAIIPSSVSFPAPPPHAGLSSSRVLSSPSQFAPVSFPSGISTPPPTTSLGIRMGGGPRTYPGGVSKWQWKRMQAKKAKQLLKARLCRERQIYEMRKRAELKAAVSELERPWEVVERAPKLFSVKADEQVKVLADRFQKPGGFDMWTDKDGPQVFRAIDGLPSARFFPKGVVHSVRPYGLVSGLEEGEEGRLGPGAGEGLVSADRIGHGHGGIRNAGDQRRDRRRNGGKLGSLNSRNLGRAGRDSRNSTSSCGESAFSDSEEQVLDSVDQIQTARGGGRTRSSDCSDQHQSRWQQNGGLKQEEEEDSRLVSPRFGRKGTSYPNPRNLECPSALQPGNGNFTERGRMIDDGKQNDEDRFCFDSSKSSSSNLPADSNESYCGASADHGNRRRQAILRGLDSDEMVVSNGERRRELDKEDSNKSRPEH